MNQELAKLFETKQIDSGSLSSPRKGLLKKIKFSSIDREKIELTFFGEKGVTHQIILVEALHKTLAPYLKTFRQGLFFTASESYQILFNKRGENKLARKDERRESTKHLFPFPETTTHPFLVALGIQNERGQVLPKKRDKFVQINQFIQLLEPLIASQDSSFSFIDLGCGKGYLTFALFSWLSNRFENVQGNGIDLKGETLEELEKLSSNLGYEELHFEKKEILEYEPIKTPDLVIALHACNTATDSAIAQAVKWKSKMILVAPCCHQELFPQLKSFPPLTNWGVLKERFASILTDGLRAEALKGFGYKVDVVEFVDPTHTPKNILIRAVKVRDETDLSSFEELSNRWGVESHFLIPKNRASKDLGLSFHL